MAKIAIIGSTGQLGYDLLRYAPESDTVVGLGHGDIEITDAKNVTAVLEKIRPDIVINAAAFNETEEGEKNPILPFSINAVGAYHVAKIAADIGAAVVLLSTDYVFDGTKPSFSEEDIPNPLNVHGASKYAGEILTRIANPRNFIIRTGWLFGKNTSHKGYNFVTLMLEKAKSEKEIKVVNDQAGKPTYTVDLAIKIYELLHPVTPMKLRLSGRSGMEVEGHLSASLGESLPFRAGSNGVHKNPPHGIYHLTNEGQASWFDFAREIFELSHLSVKVTPISTLESGSKIRRPKFSILENRAIQKIGLAPLRSWQEALARYLEEIK